MKRNFIARCKKHLCVETKTDIVIFNVLLFAPCLGTLELRKILCCHFSDFNSHFISSSIWF